MRNDTNLPATITNNAVIDWSAADPYTALANSLSAPGMQGEALRFVKGKWLAGRGKDEEEAGGKVLIADLDNVMIGWRRWWDKKITDQVVGLVAESFRPPQRNALGDLDEAAWERDNNGNAKDPWSFGFYMRLVDPENADEAYAWAATSFGAKKAIADLIRAFTKQRKKEPTRCVPVVKLNGDHYRHKDYGRVDVPALEIVDWRSSDIAPAIPAWDGSDDADLNDDVPF
jgi:hypothetical protein